MTMFQRIRAYVRCIVHGECPMDMPTTDKVIIELREQEVAARATANEIRTRREAMEPESVNFLVDRITGRDCRNGNG